MAAPRQDDLVEVWKGWGENEAELYKAMLDSYGIDAVLSGESTRLTHPVNVSKLSEVRLLVRAEDAERARELIENPPPESESSQDDPDSTPPGNHRDRPVNSE